MNTLRVIGRLALCALLLSGLGRAAADDESLSLGEVQRLAEQGDASAQYNLGVMYNNGRGVPEDEAEAVKWYRLAASQGYATAQYNLGVMYDNGDGVPEDDVQAYAWFNIAAAQGNEFAKKNKERVDESMDNERRARAQRLARQYWQEYVLPFRN